MPYAIRAVLMPVYNDWQAAFALIEALDRALAEKAQKADVVLIDDGSIQEYGSLTMQRNSSLQSISVLRLKRNLGHQRAIAVGLSYLERNFAYQEVIIMDADGEDSATDVPRLIAALNGRITPLIIFAERSKRSEGFVFKVFYAIYKLFHQVLTGSTIKYGNFSIVTQAALKRLVSVAEIWNHYVAGVMKSRLPFESLPTNRGHRLDGNSQMNFQSLLIHGLSSFSVYAEVAGIRMVFVILLFMLVVVAFLVSVVSIRLLTDLAIPGWASLLGSMLLLMLMQAGIMLGSVVLLILQSRTNLGTIPQRDHENFVLDICVLFRNSYK
jgi:hypothetical protein